MKRLISGLLLILLSALIAAANHQDCVWTYRCCEFKESDGQTACAKMCEAEINCDRSTIEAPEDLDNAESAPPLSIKFWTCKQGHRFFNGKCRKVLFDAPKPKIYQ